VQRGVPLRPKQGAPVSKSISPPRLAVRLLERLLPSEIIDAICGDLEVGYRKRCERGVSRFRADVWFWRQTLSMRVWALRRGAKRLQLTRPSREGGLGNGWGGISWLDVKLGLRMLVKQPGLTLVAVFALAIGIPFGLLPMHAVNVLQAPPPFDEADQIKMLSSFSTATSSMEPPTLYDFVQWREELTTFDALAAMTSFSSYNVMSEDGRAAPVRGSEVTASTFEIVRVPPLLGRTLIPADEVIGAPDVVLISHDLWQSRLESDPDVVGRTIRVGGVSRTVVGVMPEGFLFPGRDQLWMPLEVNPTTDVHSEGRPYRVFGRLASGVDVVEAEAELTTLGSRLAAEFPEAHARLQHEVVPFTIGLWEL
jgi:putative ABC transport system permease protein